MIFIDDVVLALYTVLLYIKLSRGSTAQIVNIVFFLL
jgi:hypothetical protein